MVDAIACMGLGYKALIYYALRTNLLEESKKELQLFATLIEVVGKIVSAQ